MSTPIQLTDSPTQKPSYADHLDPDAKEGTNYNGKIVSDNGNDTCVLIETDNIKGFDASHHLDKEKLTSSDGLSDPPKSSVDGVIEQRGIKRVSSGELDAENKKSRLVVIDSDDEAGVTKEKLDCITQQVKDELGKNGTGSLPSECLDEKFLCTVCDKVALEVHPHPLLKVITCGDCNRLLKEKAHEKVLV